MGYSFDMSGRLCCDHCGRSGGVRRRKCKYTVTDWKTNTRLPWCPAPALCSACYTELGGLNGVHGERCRSAATEAQRVYDVEWTRLTSGDELVRAAWGDWHENVPEGKTGVLFRDVDGNDHYKLVRADEYDFHRKWLAEFTTAEPWQGPAIVRTW